VSMSASKSRQHPQAGLRTFIYPDVRGAVAAA
jgi:hypothetical protein